MLFEATLTLFFKIKSKKEVEIKIFLTIFAYWLEDPEPGIGVQTSDKWNRIWILEAKKHVDPVDPDPDSDPGPQHCLWS